MTNRPDNTGRKQAAGKFQPGRSGNPSGRPPGARNATTMAIEALLEGEHEVLTRKAIEMAKARFSTGTAASSPIAGLTAPIVSAAKATT